MLVAPRHPAAVRGCPDGPVHSQTPHPISSTSPFFKGSFLVPAATSPFPRVAGIQGKYFSQPWPALPPALLFGGPFIRQGHGEPGKHYLRGTVNRGWGGVNRAQAFPPASSLSYSNHVGSRQVTQPLRCAAGGRGGRGFAAPSGSRGRGKRQ